MSGQWNKKDIDSTLTTPNSDTADSKAEEFVIPMAKDPKDELTEEEKKFMDKLDEKYKDRNDYEDTPIIAEESDVMINGENGSLIIGDPNTLGQVKKSDNSGDIVQTIMEQGTQAISELPSDEALASELKDVYDMSEDEIICMISILQRMQKGEKFSVFNALPDKMKTLVTTAMAGNNIPMTVENRNITARAVIEDVLNDVKNDQSFVEFNEALKDIAEIPSLIDFHAENYKDIMEHKIVDVAEKCKDTKPEISKSLMKISEAWKDTYTFNRQHQLLDSSESARNGVTRNIDEIYKKLTRDFTFKAEKTKYIITDVCIMPRALFKYFGNKYAEYIYKAFTCLFIDTTFNLDFNKPDEVAYVYYTIKNVTSLEFINKDKVLEFNEELITNITKLLDRIVELDKIYQEKLKISPNKRNQRRQARKMRKGTNYET